MTWRKWWRRLRGQMPLYKHRGTAMDPLGARTGPKRSRARNVRNAKTNQLRGST